MSVNSIPSSNNSLANSRLNSAKENPEAKENQDSEQSQGSEQANAAVAAQSAPEAASSNEAPAADAPASETPEAGAPAGEAAAEGSEASEAPSIEASLADALQNEASLAEVLQNLSSGSEEDGEPMDIEKALEGLESGEEESKSAISKIISGAASRNKDEDGNARPASTYRQPVQQVIYEQVFYQPARSQNERLEASRELRIANTRASQKEAETATVAEQQTYEAEAVAEEAGNTARVAMGIIENALSMMKSNPMQAKSFLGDARNALNEAIALSELAGEQIDIALSEDIGSLDDIGYLLGIANMVQGQNAFATEIKSNSTGLDVNRQAAQQNTATPAARGFDGIGTFVSMFGLDPTAVQSGPLSAAEASNSFSANA